MSVLSELLPKLESREQAERELGETWREMRTEMTTIHGAIESGDPGLANYLRILEQLTKRLRHNAERLRSKSVAKGEVTP